MVQCWGSAVYTHNYDAVTVIEKEFKYDAETIQILKDALNNKSKSSIEDLTLAISILTKESVLNAIKENDKSFSGFRKGLIIEQTRLIREQVNKLQNNSNI